MEEQLKDPSLKVTTAEKFGTTKGDLRVYNEDLSPRDYDTYPRVIVTAAEDLDKFQHGIIRIEIKNDQFDDQRSYLIQVDGLMSIVYSVYAKTLNDLRRATIRQKTVRMYGFFRKLFERIFG